MEGDLIGEWRAELAGTDLLSLEPVQRRFGLEITLRADRTAAWRMTFPGRPDVREESEAPFPITWEVSPDRILSIIIPIAPMPEYELTDWSRDAIRYEILAVSSISLGLSNRRFDGEDVIVLRRVDAAEYERRQMERYREAFSKITPV